MIDVTSILNDWGIHSPKLVSFLQIIVQFVIMGVIGALAYWIAKKWLAKVIMKLVGRTANKWDDLLFDRRFFNRLGILIVPIVIKIATSSIGWEYMDIVNRLLEIWIYVAGLLLITSVLDGITRAYESYSVSRSRPVRVFMQVIKVILYCTVIIIVISILMKKDPQSLLLGLGAFAAVLMLVFKDTILGLVAGVQLSANNMVRIGDWIVMPSAGADGDVLEISLTTVKVQNWDKTITTIPTYKLVSESFTNWRGMEESKGRRIKRSVFIDIYSVHYLSDEELNVLRESLFLKDYIEGKIAELKEYNANRNNLLDERRLTNIGTFREYMELWLASNPNINQEMTHMVRQLQPGATGLPLEIYCFSAKQAWVDYERVQADIFDHLFAVMEMFHLKVFQYTHLGEK